MKIVPLDSLTLKTWGIGTGIVILAAQLWSYELKNRLKVAAILKSNMADIG